MIQTTVTGQLAVIMLIEMLEDVGIEVVSANTDGVVFKESSLAEPIIQWWEYVTGFQTEETRYSALYSKDVNNYIAVKENGGIKCKGLYSTGGLAKNPTNTICVEAAIAKILWNYDIEEWIRQCTDFKKFITCRKVNGGAIWKKNYLGKNIRWYYSAGQEGCIEYLTNGNKVPKSDGATPCMDLPQQAIPEDIHYGWYISETYKILEDIGYGN
jgi:hypothetical protein